MPIEGAPGLGYMLRRGFDLPPLMFTIEEIEAIAVGARLVARTGDPGLQDAAESVLSKVTVVLPEALRAQLTAAPFFVSGSGAPVPESVDLSAVRQAIRDERKLHIVYVRREGHAHAADDLADRCRLLRAGDADLRVVRTAAGLPAFPRRPDHRAERCWRNAIRRTTAG